MVDAPKLYTEVEAAGFLGIAPGVLAKARRAGAVRHTVISERMYRYSEEQLLEFQKRQAEAQPRAAKPDLRRRPKPA